MATSTVALTRNAWVDLGPAPIRVFNPGNADAAVLYVANTSPDINAIGYIVNNTYWQGFVVSGPAQHVWARALNSATSVIAVNELPKPIVAADIMGIVQPYLYNFDPQYVQRIRSGMADFKAGVANLNLLCVGDSTTLGGGLSGTAIRPGSYPTQLAQMLTARGLNAGWQNFVGSSNPGITMTAADARLTLSGGFAPSGVTSVGGGMFFANSTGSLSWTPSTQTDRYDFKYVAAFGLGLSYSVDGGAAVAITPPKTDNSIQTFTMQAGSLGTHTYTINWTQGNLYVLSGNAYNSAVKEISVLNAGWFGSDVTQYKNGGLNAPYDMLNALPTLGAAGTFINLGINSWGRATPTDIPTFTAAYQTLLTAVKATSDPIIVTPIPSDTSVAPISVQKAFIDAMYALALSNNCPLIDQWKLWGSYANANSLGWMADVKHGNKRGYGVSAASHAALLLGL